MLVIQKFSTFVEGGDEYQEEWTGFVLEEWVCVSKNSKTPMYVYLATFLTELFQNLASGATFFDIILPIQINISIPSDVLYLPILPTVFKGVILKLIF